MSEVIGQYPNINNTHFFYFSFFLGVFYFSVIIFIEFHGSSSNHDKTNGVSFPHYDARLVGPEARTHHVLGGANVRTTMPSSDE